MTCHNYKTQIKENDPLFGWRDEITKACDELHRTIWAIADELRGSVDGDFTDKRQL